MTKRKGSTERYSRLELAQYRLRDIANKLENGAGLTPSDSEFLVESLKRIAQGADANEVLGVKAKRGERKTAREIAKKDKARSAIAWIASVIRSEKEGGLGISFDDAIARAAEKRSGEANFRLTDETLRTYWTSHPEWRTPKFDRPLSTLPDLRRKS